MSQKIKRHPVGQSRKADALLSPNRLREALVSDDFEALAGSWSKSEAEKFAAAVAPFSQIDRALWNVKRRQRR